MSDYGTKEARLIEANGGWRKRADRDAYSIIQLTERLREVEEERDGLLARCVSAEAQARWAQWTLDVLSKDKAEGTGVGAVHGELCRVNEGKGTCDCSELGTGD